MSKAKAERVEHLTDVPLDRPETFLRIERRHWPDGSSCLHLAKWCRQPNTGRLAPWWPPQLLQVTWDQVCVLITSLVDMIEAVKPLADMIHHGRVRSGLRRRSAS